MKRKILLAATILGLIGMQGCKKEPEGNNQNNNTTTNTGDGLTVENKNRAVLVYHTATWCGPCGSAGGPMLKRLETEYGDDLVYLNIQAGGGNPSSLAALFTRNDTAFYGPSYGGVLSQFQLSGYIPYFYVNNKAFSTSSESMIKQEISTLKSAPVKVGVAASATSTGNTFNFKVKTKFFESVSGDYHLSVFIAQDKIKWSQAVGGTYNPDYVHPMVIRACGIGSMEWQQAISNTPIATGTIAANTEVKNEYNFTYTLNKSKIPNGFNIWDYVGPQDHYALVVVWKKNGSKYEPVNGIRVAIK